MFIDQLRPAVLDRDVLTLDVAGFRSIVFERSNRLNESRSHRSSSQPLRSRLRQSSARPQSLESPIGRPISHYPSVDLHRGAFPLDFHEDDGNTPNTVNPSVKRTRHYLTEREVEQLIDAARQHGRYGHRDATMVLLAYRHGLRASELVDLQWSQVELDAGRLHVRRSKRGTPSVHPLQGDEIRALRRLRREQEASPFVFTSERGGPMSSKAWGNHFERLGKRAGMPLQVFPHMLRHACGFALANAGHDTRALQAYLGHKNIQHTVRYTELAPDRFKNFWK